MAFEASQPFKVSVHELDTLKAVEVLVGIKATSNCRTDEFGPSGMEPDTLSLPCSEVRVRVQFWRKALT